MEIAVITGGNRGVGRSTALQLARRGVGVVLTYRSHAEEAAGVVSQIREMGGKAVALPLDVGQVASFDGFVQELLKSLREEWGRETFDFLVNNAGIAQRTLIGDLTETVFDELVNVHFKGTVFLTQKLLRLMVDGGHVVNISTAMTRVASPGTSIYSAAKGAMEVFTRYIAREFMERKIRCNVVAPGALDTDFGGGRTDEMRQRMGALAVAGRMAKADDIGPVIASLLSDDLEWIDGQRIEVTGSPH